MGPEGRERLCLPFCKTGTAFIKVRNSHLAYSRLLECMLDFPARSMKIIGITGTNGKTSCVYLLRNILEENNSVCGVIGTVNYAYPGKSIPASRTTPEAGELQKLFAEMKKNNCTHVIMEVSSHALDQERIGDLRFEDN